MHRPKLQETYRRYFAQRGVAVMIFPTTPLPAAKIGEDDTVVLNGMPVPTLATYIRNLGPGSTAGIPGMSLPAGMTKAGLPVGIAIDGPAGSDQQVLAIALALERGRHRHAPMPPAAPLTHARHAPRLHLRLLRKLNADVRRVRQPASFPRSQRDRTEGSRPRM
jgi:hypothetical protein